MRANALPAPIRKDKRRLLESCAIAAGMAALAYGGPAAAQVAGTGSITQVPSSGAPTSTVPNPSTVTVTGAENIIDWTPSNAPVAGTIDFLPSTNTLTFQGDTPDYTVLNRFVGVSITDQIALNGTVESFVTNAVGVPQQGGNIWFYNAGGVLIGPGATINVGSLVLTASPIDTSGGLAPGGTIRFGNATNPGAAVTISNTAEIEADNGVSGSNYVALVAPRIVQNGFVSVNGSAAYVAAEAADITIDAANGLFNINVITGADGGDVITHGGVTTGPEQTGALAHRIYMVAIPKNDAVTMLVSGQVGYDDASSATVSNGSIILSGGYNIAAGVMNDAPATNVAANISVNDIIFLSDVTAHASNDFLGQPIGSVPMGGPFSFVPPPWQGRFAIQGNGTFIGENSATLTINPGRQSFITGDLLVQANGTAAGPGSAAITVDGGSLTVLGGISLQATGTQRDATGTGQGGSATLTIANGGQAGAGADIRVSADGFGGFDDANEGGNGRGGTAAISVSGTGSLLTGGAVAASADGFGGGVVLDPVSGVVEVADDGGDGFGGNATIRVANGGQLAASAGVTASAAGEGRVGLVESGNGTGGTARIEVSGTGTGFTSPLTTVSAAGIGGGSIADSVFGQILSANGGVGVGNAATLSFGTDSGSSVATGVTRVDASGSGGGGNGPGAAGGDAQGGTAAVEANGAGTAFLTNLTIDASATSGGESELGTASASTGGDAQGGDVFVTASNVSTLNVGAGLLIDVHGAAATGTNVGNGTGGIVVITAAENATIAVGDSIDVVAFGGSRGSGVPATAGRGTGGTVDFLADLGGSILADNYVVDATGWVANVTGTNGPAQGGNINLTAYNGGLIQTTNDSLDRFDASAQSGVSTTGSSATGGFISLVTNEANISLSSPQLSANGVSGGASTPGATGAIGIGGIIQIDTGYDPAGGIAFGIDLSASADGRTALDVEAAPGFSRDTSGDGQGGTISVSVNGGSLDGNSLTLRANGYGGASGTTSTGHGGAVTFTQIGGDVDVGDVTINADGIGGIFAGAAGGGISGDGIGGDAVFEITGGTFTASSLNLSAAGVGGRGFNGDDFDFMNPTAAGDGGSGQGGEAAITIADTAVVNTAGLAAFARGTGGNGGNYSTVGNAPGDAGNAGSGTGGNATIRLRGGELNSDAVVADAGGFGGLGGNTFLSSSSGPSTGVGAGGTGGDGSGGFATIALGLTTVNISESMTTYSTAQGGSGGSGRSGGRGGNALGGLAQVLVDDFDAGALTVALDASAQGGNGGIGFDGAGGNGGSARGGRTLVEARGPDASVIVAQSNFVTVSTGGAGGSAFTDFFSRPETAGQGGDGGEGTGGEIDIVATGGGTVGLGIGRTGGGTLSSVGNGGGGGRGADNPNTIRQPGPDEMLFTADDTFLGLQGGNGGIGGAGIGGLVRLTANGGTITSDGAPVDIMVAGLSGDGGEGGVGSGGTGSCCSGFVDFGGNVVFEATSPAGTGQILLGDTTIRASGFIAGRIELRSASNIALTSLTADAQGFAPPTNNDTNRSAYGIFFAANGGAIDVANDLVVRTDGSFGAYAQGRGQVSAGGLFQIDAADQVDLRHDERGNAANPTLFAGGDLLVSAGTTIRGTPGSLLAANGVTTLTALGPAGSIAVDQLAGDNVTVTTTGAASVEHAEADNDFTGTGGSFRTGLNSIITGGNIMISSPGAVDLGNSSAGGYVLVSGQSIDFANIDAGFFVDLTATGTVPGAEGIRGESITSGSSTYLNANSIAIGTIEGAGFLSAFTTGGDVAIDQATVAGGIGIFSQGDIRGSYAGGADIFLSAQGDIIASASAIGDGSASSSGTPTRASVYADAVGDVSLSNSAASGMFGVNAGGSAAITGATVGEDMLVLAQGTATLSGISVGDDLTVRANGAITGTDLTATGQGPDGLTLFYSSSAGFTIGQGEGASSIDGSDITLRSATASIDATDLSAGDDILLNAATSIALNGATTLGLGTTGGDSSIVTQGTDTTLAGLDAFSDVRVSAAGAVNATGPVAAGRDIVLTADTATFETLPGPPPPPFTNTLAAGRDLTVTIDGDLTGGRFAAGRNLSLSAAAIDIARAETGAGGLLSLTGAGGVSSTNIQSGGDTFLEATDGDVRSDGLISAGAITARGNNVVLFVGGTTANFAELTAGAGDAILRGTADVVIANGSASRNVSVEASEGASIAVTELSAGSNLFLSTDTLLTIGGIVTGETMSLTSGDIAIGANGRVGTAGGTQQIQVTNIDNQQQTFVGGTGTRSGYHIDADELTRLFGADISIFAPDVEVVGPASVGSSSPPDVIVDSFTLTGGAAGSNLGANGALTIRTPGKMRVIGNVQLTGLTDANALTLRADDALEVILGQGTVRLLGAGNAPGGQLNLRSRDVIVATTAAIADVGSATTVDAISSRLSQNDGVTLDDGALFARGISFQNVAGVYVQNSGTGTDFALRRGLTFAAGGLNVATEGSARIVINGVQLGASGPVTGLDTIPALTINGRAIDPASNLFNLRSTVNGCLIANFASCSFVPPPEPGFESNFPVQDVIEDEVGDGSEDEGDGTSLPTALITMRDLDPLTGEPLLDDPVTGAGNDDLWTPAPDTQQP